MLLRTPRAESVKSKFGGHKMLICRMKFRANAAELSRYTNQEQ